MAPKKPAAETIRNPQYAEVDRAMYELQIADLNRKLARLRTAVDEYEVRNEELQKAYEQLDEDRADIIAYLKKTLNNKTEENAELKATLKALEELRDEETKRFKERVTELESNFTIMKDQLTSENKLLGGKLNTLEEFRAIRDDLMRKFEKQEEDFEAQEMKYKRIIYETEKKFVIGKDKLKKEMEARILSLAQDFQDASEARIAASTHRVIRENIALNNQLDNLLYTQAKLAEQNEKLKEDERSAYNAKEVAESERDKAINKSIVQLKVIDQLTVAYQNMNKDKALHDKKVFDFETVEQNNLKLTKENDEMFLKIKILEQNLHAGLGEHNKYIIETAKLVKERDNYKKLIKEITSMIQAALKNDEWALKDPARALLERKVVLTKLLNVVTRYPAVKAESVESLISLSDVYEKGDLGLIPKPAGRAQRRSRTTLVHTPSQESVEPRPSTAQATPTISTVGTLKTVPSISVIPPRDEVSIPSKESIPSFTVTSIHSHESVSEVLPEPEEMLTDVEKQLAFSKMEIQKSILQDLGLSRASLKSAPPEDMFSKLKLSTSKMILSSQSKIGLVQEDHEDLEDKEHVGEHEDQTAEQAKKDQTVDETGENDENKPPIGEEKKEE